MSDKEEQKLAPVNDWKHDRTNKTNAVKLGRPPTPKEISAQKWRAKNLGSVKSDTVTQEESAANITEISLRFLEAWNEYCSAMDALNADIYKCIFSSNIQAGKRLRQLIKRQKQLGAIIVRASLEHEHYLNDQRALAKEKAKRASMKRTGASKQQKKKFELKELKSSDDGV
jgi:hypothetical protein